ncbi:MAG: hypothetical protein FJ276_04005 [Planctomycetes bacterium]|jgi:hypothetical protein|nr:hypothetical protein [Planctomycetota bacterium]
MYGVKAIRRCAAGVVALVLASLWSVTASASEELSSTVGSTTLPWLFGKSWAIGYALFFLAILLGLLALLIPSMRKTIQKRD